MDVVHQYDAIGESYVEARRRHFGAEPDSIGVFISDHVAPASSLLDIGCGGGDDIVGFLDQGVGRVAGVDISPVMVALAGKHVGARGEIREGGWEAIPYCDSEFDVVVGRFSLHYLESFDRAYTEAARCLKTGGRLIVSTPHPVYDALALTGPEDGQTLNRSLFGGAVRVSYFPHRLVDYFSPAFFLHFRLMRVEEFSLEKGVAELPSALAYVGVKDRE